MVVIWRMISLLGPEASSYQVRRAGGNRRVLTALFLMERENLLWHLFGVLDVGFFLWITLFFP